MMYVESTDFPLAGGAFNQAIRDPDAFSSHSSKAGSDKIHSQVPGIQRCRRKAKSSSGPWLVMNSFSTNLDSSDDWLSFSAMPGSGYRCEYGLAKILSLKWLEHSYLLIEGF